MNAKDSLFPMKGCLRTWTESLPVTVRDIFTILSRSLVALKKNDWQALLDNTVDDLSPPAPASHPDRLVFALVWKSLIQAMFEMSRELAPWLRWPAPEDAAKVVNNLDLSFDDNEFTIDSSLFQSPEDLPLMKWIKEPFRKWMVGLGMDEGRSWAAVERLSPYFASALFQEARAEIQQYRPAVHAMAPPFDVDEGMAWAWKACQARLIKDAHTPYFARETFDASQVYIPLRAVRDKPRVEDLRFEELRDFLSSRETDKVYELVDIEEAVVEWIEHGALESGLRLIASSPGAGERTFTRMLAAKLIRQQKIKVLRIPLSDFDASSGLVSGLNSFVVRNGLFPHNPMDEIKEPLLLIFEKIGELPSNGHDRIENAVSFIRQIGELLENFNQTERRLLIIVTGWSPLIKAVKRVAPVHTEIFDMLQYKILEEDRAISEGSQELMKIDQRDLWWRLYGQAIGKDYQGLPKELSGPEPNLQTMTAHPTTNYTIAGLYESGRLVFSEKTTISKIVYDRIKMSYERLFNEGKPYRWLYHIDLFDFQNILEELAVSAWHDHGHTVKIEKLKMRFSRIGLKTQLEPLMELADADALGFLESIYDANGNKVMSFTQRGLRNYLVARRIVNELMVYKKEFENRGKAPYLGLNEAQALRRWIALCGPTSIYPGLFLLIQEQLKSEDKNEVGAYQEIACRLIEWVIKHGWPVDDFPPEQEIDNPGLYTRNAAEALLAIQYACAAVTEKRGEIAWPRIGSAGEWIRRVQAQRSDILYHLVIHCLGYLDFSNCLLDGTDLYKANLFHSSFKKASLQYACLAMANLKKTNCTDADLRCANLAKANLRGAYMRRVDLHQANLRQADLRETDLSQSQMQEADLRGADLRWADLRYAVLHGADMRGADLRWAYMEETDLRGADLRGADLREVDLSRAELLGADLKWSDMQHTPPTDSPRD